MSPRSPLGYSLPEEMARVARAAFPEGSPYLRLDDVLGPIFHNPDRAWKGMCWPFPWTTGFDASVLAE